MYNYILETQKPLLIHEEDISHAFIHVSIQSKYSHMISDMHLLYDFLKDFVGGDNHNCDKYLIETIKKLFIEFEQLKNALDYISKMEEETHKNI